MFAILNILSVPFCGIKYTYTVVQPSPLSLSRSFLSFQTETPYPRTTNSSVSIPTTPDDHYSTFCFYIFDYSTYLI